MTAVNPFMLLLLLVLASYRLWRIPGNDTWPPARAFREWLARKAEHDPHEKVNAWNEISDLVECPWCLGFWISGAVVAAVTQFTSLPMPVMWWFAVSCGVGLIGGNLDG